MTHDPQAEDSLAETLADRVIELVDASHPTADPKFRRRVARLYLRQLTGSEKPPGEISCRALGKTLGVSGQRISEIEAAAIGRLYLRHHHTLRDLR
jgi:hypothetical protein